MKPNGAKPPHPHRGPAHHAHMLKTAYGTADTACLLPARPYPQPGFVPRGVTASVTASVRQYKLNRHSSFNLVTTIGEG